MIDRQQFETLLGIGGIIIFLSGFAVAWILYPWIRATEQLILASTLLAFGLLLVGFIFSLFFQRYIFGAQRLAQEVKLIMMANPAHRVQVDGPPEMKLVASTINEFSNRFQELLHSQAEQIEQGRAELEAEKNRLAALMADLFEGVLVCNTEGQILLYNKRARQMLDPDTTSQQSGGFVGLGRSVFGLLDWHAITHALENLMHRTDDSQVMHFAATATNGQLMRVRVTGIFDQSTQLNGFILTLEDVTTLTQSSRRRDMLLQSLTEGVRSSLGSIRAAIETIEEFPEMDPDNFARLKRIIYDEALALSAKLNTTTAEYAAELKSKWQLEDVLANDLLWAIQRRFEDKLAVKTTIEPPDDYLWLKVDSFSVVHALVNVMWRLKTEFNVTEALLRVKIVGRLAAFDLVWRDTNVSNLDSEMLWTWQNQSLSMNGQGGGTITLNDVAEQHGGEVWCQTDISNGVAYFRLLLPTTQPKPATATITSAMPASNRPEYYDFDLFQRAAHNHEMKDNLLTELAYTVFDTEATGTTPSEGDEIVSISAVRIVNGRLLRQEIFDQLVNPQRPMPALATQYHGISTEMVENQPTIDQVIPQFARFAESTVLIAHNAAFDMRMLQLKEPVTGITFKNPVLDTLLLSAVLDPDQKDHSLDAIAFRLGVKVIGRHTSLGDSILTGEVFLKLLPLLIERGITTLGQAQEVSKKTFYARIKY